MQTDIAALVIFHIAVELILPLSVIVFATGTIYRSNNFGGYIFNSSQCGEGTRCAAVFSIRGGFDCVFQFVCY